MKIQLLLLLFLAALTPNKGFSKTIVIAVIDTGIDKANPKLCKEGHKSFVDNTPLIDEQGHGTHIAGIIKQYAGNGDYCIVSIKWWAIGVDKPQLVQNMAKAIRYANNINVDFINISGGGAEPDELERNEIERALDNKITVVVASGNESDNLDVSCNFYPACYDSRLVVVGNLRRADKNRNIAANAEPNKQHNSNYGKYVNRWEVGTDVMSDLPGGRVGNMTGTSQAAAIATGKLIKAKLTLRIQPQRRVK